MAKQPTTAAKPATPEQIARRKAAKVIGFNTWRLGWRAANPDASKEDRKTAWAAVRKEEVGKARRVLRRLEKAGLKLQTTEA